MEREMTWEQETLSLIEETYQERKKLEQRRTAVEKSIEFQDRKIAGLELALDSYRTKYGVGRGDATSQLSPELAAEYQGLSVKQMIMKWSQAHAGSVVLADASKYLARLGMFTSERNAYGGIYSALGRMPEFEKVAPGEFRVKASEIRPDGILTGEAFGRPSVTGPTGPIEPAMTTHGPVGPSPDSSRIVSELVDAYSPKHAHDPITQAERMAGLNGRAAR